jgi:hypothetical protein
MFLSADHRRHGTHGTRPRQCLSSLDGGFRWRGQAATGSYFPIAKNEGSPNHLLARGVLGGDIK